MSRVGFQDRRIRNDERPLLAVFAVWAIAAGLLLTLTWDNIMIGKPAGPDDVMRLVQVRDLLAGQGWFDLNQYRLAPPDGALMHWSRLVDLPIAAIIAVLTPFIGQYSAEITAMIVVPLLTLGACVVMVGMLAWRLINRQVAVVACLCLILYPLVTVQMQPMRIDHHGLQILTALVALWAISWRKTLRGGAIAGFAMAAGLMISLELLPLAAGFGGVLLLRWLRDARDRWGLVGYMQSLAISLLVLFLVTRGVGDLAAHCDVISPAYLSFFLIAAVGTGILSGFGRLPGMGLVVGFGVIALIGAAFFAWNAPMCLGNPFGNLDPLVYENWYLRIKEGRPIWVYSWDFAIPALLQPIIGLGASIALIGRHSDWLRRWWMDYSLLLALAIVAGMLTTRSLAFAGAIAALPLGWLIVGLFSEWSGSKSIAKRIFNPIAILIILIPMSLANTAKFYIDQWSGDDAKVTMTNAIADTGCELDRSLAALDTLPTGTVFAFFDLGPEILRQTKHKVVASSHHRAQLAMRDVILGFSSPADKAREILAKRKADYVLICADLPEAKIYADLNEGEDALIDALNADRAPVWLRPVVLDAADDFKVWRVVR